MKIDMWTWKCLRCGWAVESARTVNSQQAVANALVRVHIQQHDADDLAALSVSPPPSEFPTEFDRLKAQKDAIVAKQRSSLFQQQILKIEELLQIANHDAQMWGLEHHDRFRKIRDMETCRTLRHVLAVLRDYPMPAAAPPEPEAAPPQPDRETLVRQLEHLRAAMRESLQLSTDAPDEDLIDQANEHAEWLINYETHLTAIAKAAGVRLNGSEYQWSEATRAIVQRLIALSSPLPSEPKPVPSAPSPSEMDCMKWAVSFVEHVNWKPSIATDEGTMMAWFSTAIMAGFDEAQRRRDKEVHEFIGWLSGEIQELHHVEVPRLADAYRKFLNTRDPDSAESKALAASPVSAVPPNEELIQILSQRIVAVEKALHQAQAENRELWALAHPQLNEKET